MADVKTFLCILLLACCVTVTLQQVPVDCCLRSSDKRFDKARVVDYTEQRAGRGCAIDATILLTKRGRRLCMPAKGKWVRAVKSYVNQLRQECKNSFQETRCAGVKLG
ncbi:C-C motif chemokine 8-like [Betta splendens]|uniref:C-C motif chemokine 8-like n=1 Tax=Betta splendens TaxID=158456 RepID=A0A6P7NHZ8_BETSP|nr:C-C motif chemokine 8-like [Betta splendens]